MPNGRYLKILATFLVIILTLGFFTPLSLRADDTTEPTADEPDWEVKLNSANSLANGLVKLNFTVILDEVDDFSKYTEYTVTICQESSYNGEKKSSPIRIAGVDVSTVKPVTSVDSEMNASLGEHTIALRNAFILNLIDSRNTLAIECFDVDLLSMQDFTSAFARGFSVDVYVLAGTFNPEINTGGDGNIQELYIDIIREGGKQGEFLHGVYPITFDLSAEVDLLTFMFYDDLEGKVSYPFSKTAETFFLDKTKLHSEVFEFALPSEAPTMAGEVFKGYHITPGAVEREPGNEEKLYQPGEVVILDPKDNGDHAIVGDHLFAGLIIPMFEKTGETDPTESQPSETDPSQTDPTESQPSETDPTDPTDPTESQPSETDPSTTDPTQPTDPLPTDPEPGEGEFLREINFVDADDSQFIGKERTVKVLFEEVSENKSSMKEEFVQSKLYEKTNFTVKGYKVVYGTGENDFIEVLNGDELKFILKDIPKSEEPITVSPIFIEKRYIRFVFDPQGGVFENPEALADNNALKHEIPYLGKEKGYVFKATIDLPKVSKDKLTFGGWYSKDLEKYFTESIECYIDSEGGELVEDLELKFEAYWGYLVTFKTDGNGQLKENADSEAGETVSMLVKEGQNFEVVTVPTTVPNEGYKFKEWSPKLLENSEKLSENLEFTAVFEALEEPGTTDPTTPSETETKPSETETKPSETETKPSETETKPSESLPLELNITVNHINHMTGEVFNSNDMKLEEGTYPLSQFAFEFSDYELMGQPFNPQSFNLTKLNDGDAISIFYSRIKDQPTSPTGSQPSESESLNPTVKPTEENPVVDPSGDTTKPTTPTSPTEPTKPEIPVHDGTLDLNASIILRSQDFKVGDKVYYQIRIKNTGTEKITKVIFSENNLTQEMDLNLMPGKEIVLYPEKLFRQGTYMEIESGIFRLEPKVLAKSESGKEKELSLSEVLLKAPSIMVKLIEVNEDGEPTGFVISDFEAINKQYRPGEKYKVLAPEIKGYDFHKLAKDSDPAEGVLNKDDLKIIFAYSSSSGLQEGKGSVKMRILEVDEDGKVLGEIEPEKFVQKNSDDGLYYDARAKDIEGYVYFGLAKDSANETGKVKKGKTLVVTHYYIKEDLNEAYDRLKLKASFDQDDDLPIPERVEVELRSNNNYPKITLQLLKRENFERSVKVPQKADYKLYLVDEKLYKSRIDKTEDGWDMVLTYEPKLLDVEMRLHNVQGLSLPSYFELELVANDENQSKKGFKLKASKGWKIQIKADPRYDYELEDFKLDGFEVKISGNDVQGFVIDAYYQGAKGQVQGQAGTGPRIPATGESPIFYLLSLSLVGLAVGLIIKKKH